MNILIVDDEPEVAEVLARSLSRQGHRTAIAHSGADALRMVNDATPDAMFLDVSMPGMNGLDVLQEVRRTRPSLAVVVITGHATDDEVEEVKRLGAVDVIPKPAALTHYHEAIERLGKKNRFSDARGL
jgi:DNA-binding NtrC family response regulator